MARYLRDGDTTEAILLRLIHCFEIVELSPLDKVLIADRAAILAALADGYELARARERGRHAAAVSQVGGWVTKRRQDRGEPA